jgi:hypothetical protein
MKKLLIVLLSFMMVTLAFAGCKKASTDTGTGTTAAKFHIGIVTGTVSQSEDNFRAGETLAKEYGDAANGGMIKTITYPDNFSSEQETVIANIVGLADDPLMKAIIVAEAVGGTTEAFKRVHEINPDILLFAVTPHEDPNVVDAAATMALEQDEISRGYLLVWAAKQMGANTFVHISFPRHMSMELLSRRRYIMEEACKDLGLKFVFETAPDPTSDVGLAGAQQFMLEKTPAWVQKYGKDTAFFCTNDGETEPLIKQIMKYGGMFVEPNMQGPLLGYPGALGIDLKAEQGDWPAILKKIEQAVIDQGGTGRFGAGAWSLAYTMVAGTGEYAKRCIEGTAKILNNADLFDALSKYTPGTTWNGSAYHDLNKSTPDLNHVLVYEDTYVFGKGYLGATKQVVPEKYLTIRAPQS